MPLAPGGSCGHGRGSSQPGPDHTAWPSLGPWLLGSAQRRCLGPTLCLRNDIPRCGFHRDPGHQLRGMQNASTSECASGSILPHLSLFQAEFRKGDFCQVLPQSQPVILSLEQSLPRPQQEVHKFGGRLEEFTWAGMGWFQLGKAPRDTRPYNSFRGKKQEKQL